MPRLISFLLWSCGALGLVTLAAILGYGLSHESHHTGWEPFTSFFLFVPLIFCGVASVLARRTRPALIRPGIVAIAVGIIGLLAVISLGQSNRLVQYDRWIQRGMP